MKIDNRLKIMVETWDDPGDYPSGAGAGPLASYRYIAGSEGEVRISDMTPEEEDWVHDDPDTFMVEHDVKMPDGILRVKEWEVVWQGPGEAWVIPIEDDVDTNWTDEPDFDPPEIYDDSHLDDPDWRLP